MPEFDEVTAFQAGGARLRVRRQEVDTTARPVRSEYVTGNYAYQVPRQVRFSLGVRF